ncbi:MAG: hypothetical protein R3F24_11445 [Gammaproteobacteria bacterium]
MNNAVSEQRFVERRHMIAVKNAMAAGVEAGRSVEASAFLLACIDYLDFIIGRFQAQGRANLTRLGPKVEASNDDEGRAVVADIGQTLDKTGEALQKLLAEAVPFRGNSPSRQTQDLVVAARRFVSFYDSVLASRKNPAQQIIDRYFTPEEYWKLTDDVTPASVATEHELYQRVVDLAPPGVAVPDQTSV